MYLNSIHIRRRSVVWCGVVIALMLVLTSSLIVSSVSAERMLNVQDLITSSAPDAPANHTMHFTTVNPVPPSGKIRIYFGPGLTMPAGFTHADVDLLTATTTTTNLSAFTHRALAAAPDALNDGVSVTTGASSSMMITLNSTEGIGAGETIRIHLGTNATFQSVGTIQLENQESPGPVVHNIQTLTPGETQIDFAIAANYVLPTITVTADYTDNEAPIISDIKPTLDELLPGSSDDIVFSFTTNEPAFCKYDIVASTSYAAMPFTLVGDFSTDPVEFESPPIPSVENTEYEYFVLCQDVNFNLQAIETIIRFTVGAEQIGPGPDGSEGDATFEDPGDQGSGGGSSSSSGGGGGGGGAGSGGGSGGGSAGGTGPVEGGGPDGGPFVPLADLLISGWSIPGATVRILQDGMVVEELRASGNGSFSADLTDLERGTYTFSVYAIDPVGNTSRAYASTIALRSGTQNAIRNMVLAPTIATGQTEITPGDPIVVFGYAPPNATVITYLMKGSSRNISQATQETTTASGNGVWEVTLPSTGLGVDTYQVLASARIDDPAVESDRSSPLFIGLGRPPEGDMCPRADINVDTRVDLTDFSIVLFNWNGSDPTADINLDGLIDLTDFSILLFCWSG